MVPKGTRIGAYEIIASLGAGGMGEVYRARDTKLDRDVAIKVLPASFASDSDRLMRFEREAKVLASLNHQHIAQIYGLEQAGQESALVMEFVNGEDLAQRIARGAVPLDEALPIARQIADALESAHEAGIIHRDLKPANIKVRPDGTVKVLDFGLAKSGALGAAGAPGAATDATGPTVTSPAMTMQGVVLGTAAYMSPEQARGKPVDKRADIWAFGCVFYEMLAGVAVFAGDTITDVLAAVVRNEPDWSKLPVDTPAHIQRLLARCLQKDPKMRLRDIGDAHPDMEAPDEERTRERTMVPRARSPLAYVATALAVSTLILAGMLAAGYARNGTTSPAPLHLSVTFAEDAQMHLSLPRPSLALSPDGRKIVYTANGGPEPPQLWIRDLDEFAPRPIPGTRNARMAAFSPDGRWIAFFADNQLKKVPTTTGPSVVLCDAVSGFGATWTTTDEIVFGLGQAARGDMGLWRVPATGGERRRVSSEFMAYPEALPDGRRVLVTMDNAGARTSSDLTIALVDLTSGQVTRLLDGAVTARYAATGHLIYLRDGELLAVTFDPSTGVIGDERVPVVSGIYFDPSLPVGNYAISASGTLAYIPGDDADFRLGLVAAGADGSRPLIEERRHYGSARVSPDGRRVAVLLRALFGEIWTIDLARSAFTKLTTSARVQPLSPIWSHDNQYIYAGLAGDDTSSIVRLSSDGNGTEERLTTTPNLKAPNAVTPDGTALVYTEERPETKADLFLLSLADGRTRPLLATPFAEGGAALSPDGRWIAYRSDRSGRTDVYVAAFPSMTSPVLVSTDGGSNPVWSRDGRRLYYNGGSFGANIAVVDVAAGSTLSLSRPRPVGQYSLADPSFDVLPDGRLLLITGRGNDGSTPELRLIVNWFEELREKLAAGRTN
jgi:serine/threonine protein kinase/Tol biopolymer transport system component